MDSGANVVANIVTHVIMQCHFYSRFVCLGHMKEAKKVW